MPGTGKLIEGKYELVEIAGEGGMATVFRAVVRGAAGFQRTVAVKRIKPEFRATKNYVDMFVEEARVGSDLAHPNIVQVYDFITDPDGSYYLVMEWVEGIDLGTLITDFSIRGEVIPWPMATMIAVGTLRGLSAAHERRRADGKVAPVIHRDVSPHNVLLAASGIVKLTDFGLARARDRVFSLTAPGTVKGKLCYLAPEVSWGKAATPASDIFSMGCVVWETLTGERLFQGRTDLEVFRRIRTCEIPPMSVHRSDVPFELSTAVSRALAKEPGDRFESAEEFAQTLASILGRGQMGDAETALGIAVQRAKARRDGQAPITPIAAITGPYQTQRDKSLDIDFTDPQVDVAPPDHSDEKK